jgi:metallo-beta-lactamase family protein
MCDGGRILHHFKPPDDPRCSIVLVSFQAPGTLGAKLLEPRPTVRFHGRDWNLWADVVKLEGFWARWPRRPDGGPSAAARTDKADTACPR